MGTSERVRVVFLESLNMENPSVIAGVRSVREALDSHESVEAEIDLRRSLISEPFDVAVTALLRSTGQAIAASSKLILKPPENPGALNNSRRLIHMVL